MPVNNAVSFRSQVWTNLTLGSSWVNYEDAYPNNGFARASWLRQGEMIYLRGMVRSANPTTEIAILPVNQRPTTTKAFTTASVQTNAYWERAILLINPQGQIIYANGFLDILSLDGICFFVGA